MATNKMMCEVCKYTGDTKEFTDPSDPTKKRCPNKNHNGVPCGETDDLFPHRKFRCSRCHFEEVQHLFFWVSEEWNGTYDMYRRGVMRTTKSEVMYRRDGVMRTIESEVPSDPDPVEEKWKRTCTYQRKSGVICGGKRYTQVI